MSSVLREEVESFLYEEAWLLDGERFRDWLGLMTQDVRYWMPALENRHRADAAVALQPDRMAFFDDDYKDLERRVLRFEQTTAWSESPATRHVHSISNIQLVAAPTDSEVGVRSVFANYRNRGERDEDLLMGRREDRLRRVDGTLRIAERKIFLAQNVLLSKNLNTFL
ncbi:3-phenylpropionate/cinnamic acid dioxygenase subunit beta [Roseiterribacter gracilis]|uniref:3-phenylpropionate/cinnamic acid dioxygenase subunit beta n=1 Tax=Roseiterribacter gracilis TaxID=2812848 RepID=A0A8S8XCZ6_9PROT|nr:3-phenylpropionate/cinnamic acid dioxygenase subunit beta [Rhodospirillales bacterium TMPK1]